MKRRISFMAALVVAVGLLAATVVTTPPALASKGSNVRGGPNNNGTTATLVLSPNPAQSGGAIFTGTGFGYNPSSFAYVNIHTPMSLYATSVATDASGNIYFDHPTAEAGTYQVEVFQYQKNKLVRKAVADLTVE
ncbi:MAG: hypothetical protein HY664_00350 [Chloroflexi bacterium]|nr:hypothetical protein [Chloroflexota bacterium]